MCEDGKIEEQFKYLRDKVATNDKILQIAINNGNEVLADYSIENGVNLNKLLRNACKIGDESLVRYLFKQSHADISEKDENGDTALMFAIRNKRWNVVRYLVAEVVKEDKKNDLKWLYCAFSLIKNGKLGINDLLSIACEKNIKKLVDLLSANGVKLDSLNCNGNLPLIIACYYNNIDVAKCLIEHGADINKRGFYLGFVPLGYAKSQKMIQLLTEYAE